MVVRILTNIERFCYDVRRTSTKETCLTQEPLTPTPSAPAATDAAAAADTLRADSRAGALLAARSDTSTRRRRGRLASRPAVTAFRSGGRLVALSTPRDAA
jgi:hypothetical protein